MTERRIKVNKRIWTWLEKTRAAVNILYGGAGAGKTWTLAQFLILKYFISGRNFRILITRKTNPSLRISNWKLFEEILDFLDLPFEKRVAEQTFKRGNCEIIFRGLDDPEKIKSTEFNIIWMEEATEFSLEDYQLLKLRLRRRGERKNKMFLTFNPVQSWIQDYFFEQRKEKDLNVLNVTYRDNPFLNPEYVEALEDLRHQDETLYQIYAKGQFAKPHDLIYTNWHVIEDAESPAEFDEIIWGLDFGFNNPTALIKIGLKDGVVFVVEEFYVRRLTNNELIEAMRGRVKPDEPVYADSAEPARIEEIERAGFFIYPAQKDVKNGIDFVKRFDIRVARRCENTIKEFKTYSWRKDRNGNILDEPVKFNDHAMDAIRYALYTHLSGIVELDII